MAESLKSFFSAARVRELAASLENVAPAFPSATFVAQASRGLGALELLDRARHIARALGEHLPPSYPEAIEILLRSLGPEHVTDELIGAGMAPFFYMPHTIFVAERGLEHFEVSMRAQYELTKRFSAEFSIRAFIAKDPERTCRVLATWARDANPHVRRLVSEGTRLRLPWAGRVAWLDANPKRVLELIAPLRDDPTTLVRRSVANSLNDLTKVDADLAIATCRAWSRDASPNTEALIKHALRSLVKKGHPGALELLGVGAKPRVTLEKAHLSARSLRIGGKLSFSFELKSATRKRQELVVDYAVHMVKANGSTQPKVFKLKRLALEPGARARFEGQVSFAPMTTRRHYPGRHHLEARINGEVFPLGHFELR